MNALMYLGQLLGGMTKIWLEVAFLLCLFAVLIFKSERITNRGLFSMACTLFALSIILPGCFMLFLDLSAPAGRPAGGDAELSIVMRLFGAAGPILFGVSLICAFAALMPKEDEPPLQ